MLRWDPLVVHHGIKVTHQEDCTIKPTLGFSDKVSCKYDQCWCLAWNADPEAVPYDFPLRCATSERMRESPVTLILSRFSQCLPSSQFNTILVLRINWSLSRGLAHAKIIYSTGSASSFRVGSEWACSGNISAYKAHRCYIRAYKCTYL
jgi:hypothetical protein